MPTFTKTEVVDARQFTGGPKNAKELIKWVSTHGGGSRWEKWNTCEDKGGVIVVETNETFYISSRPNSDRPNQIVPGGWVVLGQDGKFVVMTDEELNTKYKIA